MWARGKQWLARLFWRWSLKLGMDHSAEMEAALTAFLRQKADEYGPALRNWMQTWYPEHQVIRHGEARNTVERRRNRV